jgi:predicted dehydrogenase
LKRTDGPARIGVIGCGWWATDHHLPGLTSYEHAVVTALADTDDVRLKEAGTRFEIDTRFTDHRELLASGTVDGVVIATPHVTHYEIARDALEAGVHVLVEKPMTFRAREAAQLVSLAEAGGLHLMVGYTFHYTDHARAVRDMIRSGEIGDLQLVTGVFGSIVRSFFEGRPERYAGSIVDDTMPRADSYSDPAIAGGGQGQTQVTHLMGMLTWATDARVTETFAYMESHGLPVDLVDAVTFRLGGGAIGTVAASGNLSPGQVQHQGWTYFGTSGVIVQDMVNGKLTLQRSNGDEQRFPDLSDEAVYPAEAPAHALADLIRGKGENRSPGSSAAHVVEFLECSYRSVAEGRPVRVEELTR